MNNRNNDWLSKGRNYDPKTGKIEYYEDTHANGIYTGMYSGQIQQPIQDPQYAPQYTQQYNPHYGQQPTNMQQGIEVPNKSHDIAPRQYQNVIIYEPRTAEDVETLIDYLKRREPAIINLDKCDSEDAQRILDFTSGAMYALNGTVQRIANNIFLLSPEGVEIKTPYEV